MSASHPLPLPGLDGANPLGFLAALGAWRIADQIQPGATLRWEPRSGHWAPVLSFLCPVNEEDFTALLHGELAKMSQHRVFTFSMNLKLKPDEFENEAKAAMQRFFDGDDRTSAAFLAAFGSSIVTNKQGDIEDTAFRMLSGAGNQHFLKTMNDLVQATTKDQLRKTLFHNWTYSEIKLGLRWDPTEDKRYALAWINPSDDPTRTQRGANRLAIEALPLFPAAPVGARLETTGFTGHRSNDTYWSWPIWDLSITLDAGRSLLALRELQETWPPAALQQRGVVAVFRSQRTINDKFRNFTPAIQAC